MFYWASVSTHMPASPWMEGTKNRGHCSLFDCGTILIKHAVTVPLISES
jgi:hypothetical protein